MNDNAKKLVEALRSGEYKQARGSLRVDDRFCCLGVACDVYRKETGLGKWIEPSEGPYWAFNDGGLTNNEENHLPRSVMKWLDFASPAGAFVWARASNSLTYANDTQRLSFTEIADLIEDEPKGLFKYDDK